MSALVEQATKHLHYTISGAAVAVLGVAQLLPSSALDTCATIERDEEAKQELRDNDKQLQLVFAVALLASAVVMSLNFVSKNRMRTVFILGGAAGAYAVRLLSYHAIVIPLSASIADGVCGTQKAISGHAYFFLFHVLLWGVAYLQFCQPRRAQGPKARAHAVQKRKTSGKKGANSEVTPEEIVHFVAGAAYFVAAICAYLALSTTLSEGFHSVRHVLRGAFAASVAALLCQVAGAVAEPIVAPFGKAKQ